MLDLQRERPLTLAEAARTLPGRRGRPVSQAAVYRWCVRGVRGVKLESVRVGGQLFTTAEALARFLEALNSDDPSKQRKQTRDVLKKAGIIP